MVVWHGTASSNFVRATLALLSQDHLSISEGFDTFLYGCQHLLVRDSWLTLVFICWSTSTALPNPPFTFYHNKYIFLFLFFHRKQAPWNTLPLGNSSASIWSVFCRSASTKIRYRMTIPSSTPMLLAVPCRNGPSSHWLKTHDPVRRGSLSLSINEPYIVYTQPFRLSIYD